MFFPLVFVECLVFSLYVCVCVCVRGGGGVFVCLFAFLVSLLIFSESYQISETDSNQCLIIERCATNY